MKTKKVLAIAAHPDDIELMMAGTLFLLKEQGCELHYLNIANGSCGSELKSKEEIVKIREEEAKNAASFLNAKHYKSITDDFGILYSENLVKKVAAVVRKCNPDILLVPSLDDYMEDHIMSARIAVTAAFVRNMPNYPTDPPLKPISNDIAIYHALPYGLRDETRRKVFPEYYVNIETVMDKKTEMLAMHKSQKEWLDKSQGIDSYLRMMQDMSRQIGKDSKQFQYAEGWHRHSHLGFASEDFDPLLRILNKFIQSQLS